MTTLMVLSDPELIKFDSSLPAFRCSVGLYRPLGRSKQEEGAECSGMDIVSKDINWAQHFSFLDGTCSCSDWEQVSNATVTQVEPDLEFFIKDAV
jgi:hypothetical protein